MEMEMERENTCIQFLQLPQAIENVEMSAKCRLLTAFNSFNILCMRIVYVCVTIDKHVSYNIQVCTNIQPIYVYEVIASASNGMVLGMAVNAYELNPWQ